MIYGYYRVSTLTQLEHGTEDAQIAELKRNGVADNQLYGEQSTGTNRAQRVQLAKVMGLLRSGDTLIVTKLDRLARNTADLLAIAKEVSSKGAKLHILNLGLIDNNSPIGKLNMTMLAAIAEFEASLITDRMQSGRAYKRANVKGYKDGRHRKLTNMQLEDALEKHEKGWSYRKLAQFYNVANRTMYDRLREYESSPKEVRIKG